MPIYQGIFWRVEDTSSQARFIPGHGIWSGGASIGNPQVNLDARRRDERDRLAWYLRHHLDWYSRVVSPFISTYNDSTIAFREAERRRLHGRKGVTVTKIDVGGDLRWTIRYRNTRLLAEELNAPMSPEAWAASEHEFVFANNIPQDAIVEVHSFD